MEGGMEEEMEVDLLFYEAREVDPDYEFDAPMFFDFVREETLAEAIIAQRWFDSATSYPPSPFVAKLELREEILLKNINTSPKTKDVEYVTTSLDDDDGGGDLGPGRAATTVGDGHKGFIFYNYLKGDKLKAKTKPNSRGGSTLMRPTASLLAKQTQASRVGGSRFQLLTDQKEKSVHNSSMVEGQAAKRQKLEGGNLRKVGDGKPQTDFLHKAPAKLRLTIPREPDFETGYRAHRTRPVNNTTELEHTTVSVRRFKARPLNRKILEAPSLPIPKRSIPRMPEFQILSSKGDIGVFRNSKRQTTVPMSLHVLRGRPSGFGGKQTHTGSNGCNSEVGNQYSLRYAAARRKELGHPVRVAETT
ncbi:Protein TPX2 [Linum perenne]